MKKIFALALSVVLVMGVLCACSSVQQPKEQANNNDSSEPTGDVQMQFKTPDEIKTVLDNNDANYLIIDVRKAADYEAGHLPSAVSIDMDAAKNGDAQAGQKAMKEGLQKASGSDTGNDKSLVLVCYSGASYAQAGTNALSALGASMDKVYTLQGGMKAWTASYPDDLA